MIVWYAMLPTNQAEKGKPHPPCLPPNECQSLIYGLMTDFKRRHITCNIYNRQNIPPIIQWKTKSFLNKTVKNQPPQWKVMPTKSKKKSSWFQTNHIFQIKKTEELFSAFWNFFLKSILGETIIKCESFQLKTIKKKPNNSNFSLNLSF